MEIYLSIDDTDNATSMGSGQLAEILSTELQQAGLATHCSSITRHQLFYHDDIPYTSHNSAMCFSSTITDQHPEDVIQFSANFLENHASPGSDPGLCVAVDDERTERQALMQFGKQAKKELLSKDMAYGLAERLGVHLSEHGGTGDGVIGALAGIGLRMTENDGRFRGWLRCGNRGEIINASSLLAQGGVDDIIDENGTSIAGNNQIFLTEDKIKTLLQGNKKVVAVTNTFCKSRPAWATLSKAQVRCY